jgi:hypothetical protein
VAAALQWGAAPRPAERSAEPEARRVKVESVSVASREQWRVLPGAEPAASRSVARRVRARAECQREGLAEAERRARVRAALEPARVETPEVAVAEPAREGKRELVAEEPGDPAARRTA